jgi:hypothetical protein
MSDLRVRPRSSIVDPDLARVATVDLPTSRMHRPGAPQAVLRAAAALRRPAEPERPIILTLAPVAVRANR